MSEFRHWPFRVVWARQKGWLEVEDPFTGQWIEVFAKDAPRHWVRLAMEARDPRKIAAEKISYRGVRINELAEELRRLPGYA
jgi:hypothetical protein